MKASLLLFVLLTVTCYGEPPTPILDALISGAENIRSRVKGVGSFLEKIAHPNIGGLNLGSIFKSKHEDQEQSNRPPPNMNKEDQKTVYVFIENQGPGHQHYGPGPNPPFHNNRPDFPKRPGFDDQPHVCDEPNNGQYIQNNGPCNHIHDQNSHGNSNTNIQQNESTPTTDPINKPDKNYNDGKHEDKTKNPTDDEPLRVPLNPNEYIYGGDKIEINAPKRETNNADKNTNDEDEEFPIDLRFGNK